MTRAVITGANGMLGVALTRELLGQGAEVLALVRKGPEGARYVPRHPRVRVVECDLEDLHQFSGVPGDAPYEILYHFAWAGTFGPHRDDAFLQEGNIRHTLEAVSLAKRLGCSRFVGAGSQAEYGMPQTSLPLAPDTPAFPTSGYGIAKLSAGRLGRLHAHTLGISFVWARILSVYGPLVKPETLIPSTILKLLRGEPVHFTKGEQVWDFLYATDAARAFRLLGERGKDGETYVLGSGQPILLSDALSILCRETDPAARVGLGDLPYPPGQIMRLEANIEKLRADTGFEPQVAYVDGIRKTIAWIKENL